MDGWIVDGYIFKWTAGCWMDRWKGQQTDKETGGWMEGWWIVKWMNSWAVEYIDKQNVGH